MTKDFKYLAFYNEIKQRIQSMKYLEGNMLPSETKFMAEFHISRITVRNALALLEQEGYIYRIQGKGCYVAGNFRQQSLDKIHSYTDAILDAGMTPSRIILSKEIQPSTKKESALLYLKENDPIFKLKRIILADNLPICLTTAILPYPKLIDIDKIEFATASLYDVLENKYDYPIERTKMNFEASAADQYVSEMLKISENTPLLFYNSVAYSKIGKNEFPIELCQSHYLTDKIKYRLDKRR